MIIKEFRVPLPLTVEEYQIGQLYSVAQASLNETGGGEGVEVLRNEPFNNHPLIGNRYSSGQYTYKIYHLAKKVPAFIRFLAPKNSLELHEEAWNAYPCCKTVITNPGYMKDNFYIIIQTMHVEDKGNLNNVHELPPDQLCVRKVVTIDIANDPVSSTDYKESEDPRLFTSERTGRGPLGADWINTSTPIMTCYKLVQAKFKWFGLQNRVESVIHHYEQRLFTIFHRQLFCWIDRWHEMTMEDIRQMEHEIQRQLIEQRKSGPAQGHSADTDGAT